MGSHFSRCVGGGSSKDRELPCVLLVGLDGSGTTTILYHLKHNKHLETIPTLGLNKEIVKFDNLEFELYDVGGLEKVRTLWRTYSKEANGVAYVVDSSDPVRIDQASTELKKLFFGDKKKKSLIVPDIPLLVFANKTDLDGAMSIEVISRGLELHDLPVRNYKVLPAVATEGKNLKEGMSWMVEQLRMYGYR